MNYESVGSPYRPKYVARAEHHQAASGSTRICCAPHALLASLATQSESAGASYSNVYDTEGSRWKTTALKI